MRRSEAVSPAPTSPARAYDSHVRAAIAFTLFASIWAGAAARAWGDVRVEKVLVVPDFGAEELYVVNRLGAVTITGWDRPELRVKAVKKAAGPRLAEQMRVQVMRRPGGRLAVATFVRVRPALAFAARQRLHNLLLRQQRLLRVLVSGRSSADELEQLGLLDQELGRLRPLRSARLVQTADLSVPVSRASVDLEITVPRQLRVRARTLRHDLALAGCQAGATLSTERGAISVRDTRGDVRTFAPRGTQRLVRIGGNVIVEGTSGDVVLRQVEGGVRVAVVTGGIDAEALGASSTELRTIGGQIRLAGPLLRNARYRLISLNGDLIVELPLDASARLQGRAPRWDFGRFRPTQMARTDQRVDATLGRGEPHLQLSTAMGQVRLVALTP